MTLIGNSDSGPTYARAHRGPLWWRLRVRLAELLGEWACALEPDDKSSTSWYSDDGQSIYFATIRRPER
jgi:hypothetical protein